MAPISQQKEGKHKKLSFICLRPQKVKSLSHVRLSGIPWTVAHQVPPSMEFSRQEYWSGLPFPSPGDLPDLGIKPGLPSLQTDALPSEPPGHIRTERFLQPRMCAPEHSSVVAIFSKGGVSRFLSRRGGKKTKKRRESKRGRRGG